MTSDKDLLASFLTTLAQLNASIIDVTKIASSNKTAIKILSTIVLGMVGALFVWAWNTIGGANV